MVLTKPLKRKDMTNYYYISLAATSERELRRKLRQWMASINELRPAFSSFYFYRNHRGGWSYYNHGRAPQVIRGVHQLGPSQWHIILKITVHRSTDPYSQGRLESIVVTPERSACSPPGDDYHARYYSWDYNCRADGFFRSFLAPAPARAAAQGKDRQGPGKAKWKRHFAGKLKERKEGLADGWAV
jgi:hypothetical protein